MKTDFWRSLASFATVLAFLLLPSVAVAIPIHRQLTARSEVVCVPATWQDIIAFYVLNYATHALTIKSSPGDTTETTFWIILFALFIPFAGVWRACLTIANGTFNVFGKTGFQDAARVGALCAVFRNSDWKTRVGEEYEGCRVDSLEDHGASATGSYRLDIDYKFVDTSRYKVHGGFRNNSNNEYDVGILPGHVRVIPRCGKGNLSHSRGILNCVAALIQLGFSCISIYRARQNQVEQYGYAAFGLTVVPYAVMSLVNLTAHIVSSDYPTIFLVRSEVMDEAERRHRHRVIASCCRREDVCCNISAASSHVFKASVVATSNLQSTRI